MGRVRDNSNPACLPAWPLSLLQYRDKERETITSLIGSAMCFPSCIFGDFGPSIIPLLSPASSILLSSLAPSPQHMDVSHSPVFSNMCLPTPASPPSPTLSRPPPLPHLQPGCRLHPVLSSKGHHHLLVSNFNRNYPVSSSSASFIHSFNNTAASLLCARHDSR